MTLTDRVKGLMREFNPWWENQGVAVPSFRRRVFPLFEKFMKTRQMVAIVGLRRVGKTVLMKQSINDLLKITNKENVFYFLFDDLTAQHPEVLEELLGSFLKTIAGTGLKYVFLDEIQKVDYWQDVLKRFYDTRDDVKFVISGSASLEIKKSRESLAGRMLDIHVPVFTFREFLELQGIAVEKPALEFDSLKSFYEANLHKRQVFEAKLLDYVFKGAFPEIAFETDREIITSYIRSSVIDKIVLEDIPIVFRVKKREVLSALLEYASRETSNLFELSSVSNSIAADYQTCRSYLFFLEHSFVLDVLLNYSRSFSKQLRKSKKIHIAHPCISMAFMRLGPEVLAVSDLSGRFMETIAFQHSRLISNPVHFWRTPQKREVDLVLEQGNGELLPVEVKYSNSIQDSDAGSVVKFLDKYSGQKGVVITRDLLNEKEIRGKKILFIPMWLFLLTI